MTELGKVLKDLIDENIKLKEEIKKQEKKHLEGTIGLLKMLFPDHIVDERFGKITSKKIHSLSIYQIIKGFEERLEKC